MSGENEATRLLIDELKRFIDKLEVEYPRLIAELDAAQRDCASWAARAGSLHGTLNRLVSLEDGPRDEHYRRMKDAAWERARETLRAYDEHRAMRLREQRTTE